MYKLVYALLYVFSLLPWTVLYGISYLIYLLLYYIIRYRREIVLNNLKIAFPDKEEEELISISKQFYKNLVDSFIETLKLLSMPDRQLEKRCTGNFELVNNLLAEGRSVQLFSGHYFNWEIANLAGARRFTHPYLALYLPIKNKVFDKLILKIRSRYNSVMIPATHFRSMFHKYSKTIFVLGSIADQSAGHTLQAYWTEFFNKRTPFVKGPEKGAKAMNSCVVMTNFYKIKRGYYNIEYTLLTDDPRNMAEGELTKKMISFIEDCIRRHPDNYLWSHRRWKWQFDEAKHGHLVI